ncbi:MAG: glutathione S-transferase [Rhodosalinus sp.]
MTDYTLHYWPIPFRGHFARAALAHAGADWAEAGTEATAEAMDKPVSEQAVPHMAPPLLIDHRRDSAVAQMPAIMAYLGAALDLMPGDPARDALALKAVLDGNDVLDEITRDGGRQIWDAASWEAFEPRLSRWMAIFEETGNRHGLTAKAGWMLGTGAASLADLAAWALWSPMTRKLPPLRGMLEREVPATAGLVARLEDTPPLARLRERSDAAWGESYCGGQIERSLRAVLGQVQR